MTDLRLALRQLRRTPGFTIVAVLTLALGIGVATTVFAVVDALVLRPTAVADLNDVYLVQFTDRRPSPNGYRGVSVAAFAAVHQAPPDPVQAVASYFRLEGIVQMPGRAERVVIDTVAGDYTGVFGLRAQAGRWIDRDDERDALPHVVLSDRLWREWLAGNPASAGRTTVHVEGAPMTVVGIAPRGYRGLSSNLAAADVWIPDSTYRTLRRSIFGTSARSIYRTVLLGGIYVKARPGSPRAGIESAMAAALAGTAEAPDPSVVRATVRPAPLRSTEFETLGYSILGLASLVLVAACANLANMLYARGTRRVGEVAVRLALGASRARIFRLVAAESVIVAAAAVALGMSIAIGAIHMTGSASDSLFRARAAMMSRTVELSADWRVVAFAIGAGLFAVIAVGFTTAWRASRVSPLQSIGASGVSGTVTTRGRRLRLGFVAVQVTVAVILVMAAGLYVRRALETFNTRVLFDTSRVAAARVDLSLHSYSEDGKYNATRGRAFYQRVLANISKIPGVAHAALSDGLPGHAYASTSLFLLIAEKGTTGTHDPVRRVTGAYAGVSSGFIDSLGLRVLRGRSIMPSDGADGPFVVVLGEGATTRLWPDEDAIGKRVMFGNDGRWRTVVGVVSDPIRSTADTDWSCKACVAFAPWEQLHRPRMLVMASADDPAALVEPLRAAIREADPDVAILDAAPLDDSILGWTRPMRAATWLMAALGIVALAISTLGVYGVVSYFVSQRTREFGIRAALGATPGRILKSVLDEAIHLVLVGLLPGVFLAAVGSRIAEVQIARLMPNDIPTWFIVPVLILIVGVIAGYVPARRAAKVQPMVALRDL